MRALVCWKHKACQDTVRVTYRDVPKSYDEI